MGDWLFHPVFDLDVGDALKVAFVVGDDGILPHDE
jgi:hypothetical protein